MLLRNETLQNVINSFEDRINDLKKINSNVVFAPYQHAVERCTSLKKYLVTLFNNIKELSEFNEHVKSRQKLIYQFVLRNKDKLEENIKRNKLKVNVQKLLDIMKIISESKLFMQPILKDDFSINDMIDRLETMKHWFLDDENLNFFSSIDELNFLYMDYYNFFKEFFTSSPDIANQKTLKFALNTKENANDAAQFEKILQEPTAMFGRFMVFFATIEKNLNHLLNDVDWLIENQIQMLFKSKFNELKLSPDFLQEANRSIHLFIDELNSTRIKTNRFNKRQEELEGLGDRIAKIRFDLCRSNIHDPNMYRKFEYKIYCEYFQTKLDRFIIYLDAYAARCVDSIFSKHNANGKVYAGEIKKFWSDKYKDAYIQLQKTLAESHDFLETFQQALNSLLSEATALLKQYNDQGGFSAHSGKTYVMAYIKEIAETVEHIHFHQELPMHPDFEEQLKKIGSSDEERKKYYEQLTTSSIFSFNVGNS